MKKVLNFLLVGVLALGMFSCSDDDENIVAQKDYPTEIVGKWLLTGLSTNIEVPCEDESGNQVMTKNPYKYISQDEKDDVQEFKNDNTFGWMENLNGNFKKEGTYSVKGNKLTLTYIIEEAEEQAEEREVVATIKKIVDNKAIVEIEDYYEEEVEGQENAYEVVDYITTMIMERQ